MSEIIHDSRDSYLVYCALVVWISSGNIILLLLELWKKALNYIYLFPLFFYKQFLSVFSETYIEVNYVQKNMVGKPSIKFYCQSGIPYSKSDSFSLIFSPLTCTPFLLLKTSMLHLGIFICMKEYLIT